MLQAKLILELVDRLKYLIIAVLALPFFIFTSIFMGLMPSGSNDVLAKYQKDVAAVDSQLHWQDVYIFDYFRYQNDFSHVTDSDIRASANRFVHPVETTDSKGKKQTVKEYYSLLDVMRQSGYSQEDYQMALDIESLFGGDISSGSMPFQVVVAQLKFRSDVTVPELYNYVHQRGSIFSKGDIQTIYDAAKNDNLNPALLIAITGQEQSFVPAGDPDAQTIRLNPFNVYHSWMEHHVSLQESATVAANTVAHKLSYPVPDGEDPILWINDPNNPDHPYAEDTHWAYGVEDIFGSIMRYCGVSLQDKSSAPSKPVGINH